MAAKFRFQAHHFKWMAGEIEKGAQKKDIASRFAGTFKGNGVRPSEATTRNYLTTHFPASMPTAEALERIIAARQKGRTKVYGYILNDVRWMATRLKGGATKAEVAREFSGIHSNDGQHIRPDTVRRFLSGVFPEGTPVEEAVLRYEERVRASRNAQNAALRRANAALTVEQRSSAAKIGASRRSPEQRSSAARLAASKKSPEQRSAAARLGASRKSPEQRSAAGILGTSRKSKEQLRASFIKGWENKTLAEQREWRRNMLRASARVRQTRASQRRAALMFSGRRYKGGIVEGGRYVPAHFPFKALLKTEQRRALGAALGNLPTLQRDIIRAVFYERETIGQLIERTGMSERELLKEYDAALNALRQNRQLREAL